MSDINLISTIYSALGETYEKFGMDHMMYAVEKCIVSGDFFGITNGYGNRVKLIEYFEGKGESIAPQNPGFNYTFFEGLLDCYIKTVIKENAPKSDLERNILATAGHFKNNARSSEIIRNQLISKAQIDMNSDLLGREYDAKGRIGEMVSRICESYQKDKAIQRRTPLQASNVQVHAANMEKAKEGIISGLTVCKVGTMDWGPLHACTSIGKKRTNQEDAILIKTHPQNNKFKLLAVSDGMGGAESGEVVSDYTVVEISKWFSSLPAAYYKTPEVLSAKFESELKRISTDVANKYHGNAGATFVGAIVCEGETIVTNIGDSRAYTYNRATNQLIQQSEDHSLVEQLYNAKMIKRRDDMRFHQHSNSITQYIGMQEDQSRSFAPNTWLIDNLGYDQLLLVSDGVSDCLSDAEILVITKKTPREKLAQMLVSRALDNVSVARPELPRDLYYDKIYGGKDNTSAVTFDNER